MTWEVRAEAREGDEKGECVDAGFVDEVAAARRARRLEKRFGRRCWAKETPPPKPEPQTRSGHGAAFFFSLAASLAAAPYSGPRRR